MSGKAQPVLSGGVDAWLLAFTQPTVLIELGVLVLCALLAWALGGLLRRGVRTNDARSILFGRRVVDGVLFPAAATARSSRACASATCTSSSRRRSASA